ncbi:hypothetical protein L873DRAFT_1817913 [Choiromyces venosus 120613-1]|uniref:Uncharacterized protein n=1 Tax=Choiromyces venosus 120613-1 TaxID=1336337 RepID=A0A3N4J1V6_9PEZI|nr:hypothetical protein L873DRAFT_1817913 [Choiromyces venosus 120613-1]
MFEGCLAGSYLATDLVTERPAALPKVTFGPITIEFIQFLSAMTAPASRSR